MPFTGSRFNHVSARLLWSLPSRLHDLIVYLTGWRIVAIGRDHDQVSEHHWEHWS